MSTIIKETTSTGTGMTSGIELVSPALAEQWLKESGNVHRRRVRWRKVSQYARDMKEGNWPITSDAIAFAADGSLANGQHRLHAVIEADVTVPMFVIRGIDIRAYAVLDQPERRSAGDYLHQFLPNHLNKCLTELASLTRSIINFDRHKNFVKQGHLRPIGHEEIFNFVLNHGEELHEIIAYCQRHGMRDLATNRSINGTLYWYMLRVDEDDAHEFFSLLESGAGMHDGHPILTLRQTLVRHRIAHPAHRPHQNHMAALVIKAWNHWRDGNEDVKILVWRRGGKTKEPFPTIR